MLIVDRVSVASEKMAVAGFSHRDSAHRRPLWDALAAGCRAIEVDVWLRDGRLLVGHDEDELDPLRSLDSDYLRPLAKLAGDGALLSGDDEPLILVLDVKTPARRTWRRIEAELAPYDGVLTRWENGLPNPGAVIVLVSGNRAVRTMARQRIRLAAVDGRLPDLRRRWPRALLPSALVPMVSADWTRTLRWDGIGPVPPRVHRRLTGMVAKAHRGGRTLRFWATPDAPGPQRRAVWSLLRSAGVDYLNSDDLPALAAFLTGSD